VAAISQKPCSSVKDRAKRAALATFMRSAGTGLHAADDIAEWTDPIKASGIAAE